MKKKILIAIPVLLVLLVVASGSRTNPPIERTVNWDSPATKALFYRACADCHSHETKWPWYSRVAPVSWRIIHDVSEGREEFNISGAELGEADEAAEKLEEGEMPLSEYLRFHPEARLSATEKDSLVMGLRNTFGDEGGHGGHGKRDEHGEREHDD